MTGRDKAREQYSLYMVWAVTAGDLFRAGPAVATLIIQLQRTVQYTAPQFGALFGGRRPGPPRQFL